MNGGERWIKELNWMIINQFFSSEEFKVLRIFYNAGYDLIKRIDEGDLIVAKIIKENEGNVILELIGEIIPEEWFECIKPETAYYFEDIFDNNV